MKKAVVLAGNYAYSDQILTTIKSVCYHNRGVKFYILNADFPTEFFIGLNRKLSQLNCEVVNARVEKSLLEQYRTAIHYTVFLRYFVADFVVEDRAIYLDSDMVITGDLTDLFEMDMKGKPLAAVKDYGLLHYGHQYKFNAGFQVIDVPYWREKALSERLIQMTNKLHDQVPDGDQSILNLLFEENWLELSTTYNYITIHSMFYEHRLETQELPVTIHYLTARKPWFPPNQSLFREVWWFYHDLEWSEIADYTSLLPLKLSDIAPNFKYKALIFTHSDHLEQIDYLIKRLPYVQFQIAAWVYMSPRLKSLLQYENVSIHESLAGLDSVIEDLYRNSDVLLDINHFTEVGSSVKEFTDKGKPVLAFDNTVHGEQGQEVFSHECPETMAARLDALVLKASPPRVMDIEESLDYIVKRKCSIARFGDGELDLIQGKGLVFQCHTDRLSRELSAILTQPSSDQLMVCLPDVFEHTDRLEEGARQFWDEKNAVYQFLLNPLPLENRYGDTGLSRCYLGTKDKSKVAAYFGKLKEIWQDRDIVIVEGAASRSGVGNDLFAGAKSIKRILCPSKHAYQRVEEIEQAIRRVPRESLILLMLGPTATVLAARLSQKGYQAIDIGHIDSEYEWFQMGATSKIQLANKHTAEYNFDAEVGESLDPDYRAQIIENLNITPALSALVVTTTDRFEGLEELIHSCPDVLFTIAAPGGVSTYILSLLTHKNVVVESNFAFSPNLLTSLIERHDVLLDIYEGTEFAGVISQFALEGKPVLAFDNTKHGEQGQEVFSHECPEAMAERINQLMKRRQGIQVKDSDASLDYILETGCSVVRFGDGEIALMNGGTIPYQTYNAELAQEMKAIIARQSSPSLMVCLPDVFERLERYNSSFMYFWQDHLTRYQSLYEDWCPATWYGSTFLSRPYIDLVDKTVSAGYFAKLKRIWQDRDILIVEGRTSRSGVGNDLFAGAKSIKRILCPSKDAYRKIDQIEKAVLEEDKTRLVLIMLGPTAKVLATRLSEKGYQAIDIGHIDSEYEWFKLGVTHKVKLAHKHTAEFNFDEQIQEIEDAAYQSQIVKDLSLHTEHSVLILTHSELLENATYLIEHLPQVQFVIGTHGAASSKLEQLAKYDNVSFYTSVSAAPDSVLADFIDKSSALLDINHEMEYETIIKRYMASGKPILAFDNTKHGEGLQVVFSHERPEDMVEAIKALIEREKK